MSFEEKFSSVRCFLFDMDGTVYLGEQLLPGASDFLFYLRDRQIPFFFLTNNSSKSQNDYAKKLNRLGLPFDEEQIFTSGEATAIYLKKQKPGARLFVAGTPSLEEELSRSGFELVQEAPDFAVLGFDTTLTYAKLWKFCDFVREGRPYIATHPDINCPTETGFMPDIGAMMALIAASTGRQPDVVIGKPNAPIVQAIVDKTGFAPHELVMFGDRLYTDIAMGHVGLTTVLVLSGETHLEDVAGSPFQPDVVVQDLGHFHQLYAALKA